MSRPVPDDFAAIALSTTVKELQYRYQAGGNMIRKWLKAAGIDRPRIVTGFKKLPPPDDFAEQYALLTLEQLRDRYGVARHIVQRWCDELRIDRAVVNKVKEVARRKHERGSSLAPVHRTARDSTRAGMAADFLRRLGPVSRCNDRGRADLAGHLWRRGSTVMTDGELIERAQQVGWVETTSRY